MILHHRARRGSGTVTLATAVAMFLVMLAVAASVGMPPAAPAAMAAASSTAWAARTLNVTDTAHLRYIRETGSLLLEEGQATGALPGKVSAKFNVGATVVATFTVDARGGSISGRGYGTLHGAGQYASFGGQMTVTTGTGRYAHARGHGGFYGVLDRSNYSATIQTTGTLTY
jgi:hypothetical protein